MINAISNSFARQERIDEEVVDVAASGGTASTLTKPSFTRDLGNQTRTITANACVIVMEKNSSQEGGSEPIARHYATSENTPTASVGIPMYDAQMFELYGSEISNFKIISTDGNQPKAHIIWFYIG